MNNKFPNPKSLGKQYCKHRLFHIVKVKGIEVELHKNVFATENNSANYMTMPWYHTNAKNHSFVTRDNQNNHLELE